MNSQERLDKYLSIVPTTVQKRAQRENFNVFFHYGLNTLTGKEWGDGKIDRRYWRRAGIHWLCSDIGSGVYGYMDIRRKP